jgi:2-keto-3-deoxy-L-rhamnonate aldolase RhmA
MTPFTPLQLPLDRRTVATFVKTDSPQVVEVLGLCSLDYVVLDAEHAPFDRQTMDRMVFAARAVGLPMLVRVPDHRDATILSVLDLGAHGIVVPHVDSAADAATWWLRPASSAGGAACRFRPALAATAPAAVPRRWPRPIGP